jgi:hypothetical protein
MIKIAIKNSVIRFFKLLMAAESNKLSPIPVVLKTKISLGSLGREYGSGGSK